MSLALIACDNFTYSILSLIKLALVDATTPVSSEFISLLEQCIMLSELSVISLG